MTIPAAAAASASAARASGGLPLGFGGGLGFITGSSGNGQQQHQQQPSDLLLLVLTILATASLLYSFFVLRPRTKGGASGPPIVTSSPVCSIPVIGTIVEFGKSPVKMVQRCYEDYGPVFTVPVRRSGLPTIISIIVIIII